MRGTEFTGFRTVVLIFLFCSPSPFEVLGKAEVARPVADKTQTIADLLSQLHAIDFDESTMKRVVPDDALVQRFINVNKLLRVYGVDDFKETGSRMPKRGWGSFVHAINPKTWVEETGKFINNWAKGCQWYPSICSMKNELKKLQPIVRSKQSFLKSRFTSCNNLLQTAKTAHSNNNAIADIFKQALDVSTELITYLDLFMPTSSKDPDAILKQSQFYTSSQYEIAQMKDRLQRFQMMTLSLMMLVVFPSPTMAFMVIAGLGLEIGMEVFKQKKERDKLKRVLGDLKKARDELDKQIKAVDKKCDAIQQNWVKTVSNFKEIVTAVRAFAAKIKGVFPKFNIIMTGVGSSGIQQSNILGKQTSIINYVRNEMLKKIQDAFKENFNVTMENIDAKMDLVKTIITMVKQNAAIRNIFLSIPSEQMTKRDVIRVIARFYPQKKCYSSYPLEPIRKAQDHFMYRIEVTKKMRDLVTNLTYLKLQVDAIKQSVNGAFTQNLSDQETLFLIATTRTDLTTYLGNNLKSICS